MVGTVTTDLSFFTGATSGTSNCDGSTDWSGSPTLDTETKIEGNGSLSAKVSNKTVLFMYTLTASVDLSDTLLFVWMNCATPNLLAAKASGGLLIRVEDGSANWAEWYVAGNDTYFGGWECFVIRTNQSTDRTESATPPTYSAITKVGLEITTTGSVSKTNFWFDAMRYGTKMGLYGGTSGDPASLDDFIIAETANAYGCITVRDGVLFVQSKLEIGSVSAGVDTYFKETSKVIVFRNRAFGTFYDIKIQGNSTGDTQIYFGEKSGARGISGCIIRSAGVSKFTITASDVNIDNFGLYGCTIFDSGDGTWWNAVSSNREVVDTTFEVSGEQIANLTIFKYCNFIAANDRGIRCSTASHNISDVNFINCGHGAHFSISTSISISNWVFSGSNGTTLYDIEHSVSGILIISAGGTSNPNESYVEETGGGSTTINNTKTLKLITKNLAGNAIEGVRVRIEKESDGSLISNGTTNASGEYIDATYNYGGDVDVKVVARLKGYKNSAAFSTIESTGLTVPFTMNSDPAVNLP